MNNLSPLKHRLTVIKIKFNSFLFPQKNFFQEAFDCYLNKLPVNIKVEWERDENDGFIVGHINADNNTFIAQGKNAKEFIEMVNDAIYAVYDIPPQYISQLGYKKYYPNPEQLEKLKDKSIKFASFGFNKQPVPIR